MAAAVTAQTISVKVSPDSSGALRIDLSGHLDVTTLAKGWEAAVRPAQNVSGDLTIDVSELIYCDGAGLGLFAELRKIAAERGSEMKLTGVRPDLQRFLEMAVLKDPLAKQLAPRRRENSITYVGRSVALIARDLRELITFTGELTATLCWGLLHPRQIRWRDTLRIAEKAGADAVPVIALLGFLIGAILAFQSAGPLRRFGAQAMIPTMVSIAVIREMGALITAVALAGRSGSAFAAEIGTMQVTEELSALKTLGVEPARFLVLPRVLAALLVTPLLTAFNILMSLVGTYVVMASLGYSLSFFINQVSRAATYGDFLGGVFKSLVFAIIIAGIGCLRGMQTKSGPGAVGDSTTRAVVAGIVYCIMADAVIGVIYYYTGV